MKRLFLLSICLFFLSIITVHAQRFISTIAGTGNPGFSGDSGIATLAKLNGITDIVTDKNGNVYILDAKNFRIRKVAASSKIITTIAGNGTIIYSGDSGLAVNAGMLPTALAMDTAGDLYIFNDGNGGPSGYKIRRINMATGIITAFAGKGAVGYSGDGGSADSARLYTNGNGVRLAFDKNNNLYVTDQFRMRKIDAATHVITTVVGNNTGGYSGDGGLAKDAQINFPTGMTFDDSNNLYFIDQYSNLIRKISATTGIITTFAGLLSSGYSGDGGSALKAEFNSIQNICSDHLGNIFIADGGNNVIRKIDRHGIITTIAGVGGVTGGWSGDGGFATKAKLNFPFGVCVDSRGYIYVTDQGNSVVRMITVALDVKATQSISFKISPNPSTGMVYIQNVEPVLSTEVYVSDVFGKCVYQSEFNGQCAVDLTNEPNGFYFIHLTSGENSFVQKIIIGH